MQPQSYAIIGSGALGAFYGARLQKAGCEVHFLLHHDYDHVRTHGLVIESKDGDFVLPKVHAHNDVRSMPPCEVVMVALKTTSNQLLGGLLPPLLRESTVILVMQNGLGIEAEVARIAPDNRVLGGLCFLCSNRAGPGHIRHLDYGHVKLAEYSADERPQGETEPMRRISADLRRAGIGTELVHDLKTARWQKLVWNVPYNGLSVVLNANTSELMASRPARQLVESVMQEVVADAAGCGCSIPQSFIQTMLTATDKMPPYRASMKIDYDERRPMEIEAIYGNPVRAAQAAGVKSPLLEAMYRQLKYLEEVNQAGR